MKAINEKELRLGNLILGIYYTEDDEGEEIEHDDICEVLAINNGDHFADYSIYVDSKSDTEIFSSFHPIPLTEEWLVKLGFERIENNWKCLNLQFATISWERLAGLTLSFEKESIYLPHIKSVHQLQNLYFALTGQELTIKHN